MDIGLISLLMVIMALVMIFIGVPISFCLITTSLLFTLVFWGPAKMSVLVTSAYGTMINPTFLAVPLFIFMAFLLQYSGITEDLFDAIWKWLGGVPGGLAVAGVVAITILSAMTGVGATGIFTIGKQAIPEMQKRNYDLAMAIGPVGPSSALGPLIPPSNIMIILGGLASLSIGALFMGGFIPGFMISMSFIIYILVKCIRNPKLAPVVPIEERPSFREKLVALRGVASSLILIVLVLGGIWTGVCTAVEGSGIGAIGAFVIALTKRRLTLQNLTQSVTSTLQSNVMIMWLLIGGSCYAAFMSASGMAIYLGNMLMNVPLPPFGILCLLMFILFLMGLFMDSVAIIMITVPIFFPICNAMKWDPIWFGVLYTMAVIIGYVTPPFGYNLFYMRAILPPEISTRAIFRTVWPYVWIMLGCTILCMVFPRVILFLPSLLI